MRAALRSRAHLERERDTDTDTDTDNFIDCTLCCTKIKI